MQRNPKKCLYKIIEPTKIKKTSTNLTAYTNSEISVCVENVSLRWNIIKKVKYKVLFIVVNSDAPPILGLITSERLNLIRNLCTVNASSPTTDIVNKFSECFGEIGSL